MADLSFQNKLIESETLWALRKAKKLSEIQAVKNFKKNIEKILPDEKKLILEFGFYAQECVIGIFSYYQETGEFSKETKELFLYLYDTLCWQLHDKLGNVDDIVATKINLLAHTISELED